MHVPFVQWQDNVPTKDWLVWNPIGNFLLKFKVIRRLKLSCYDFISKIKVVSTCEIRFSFLSVTDLITQYDRCHGVFNKKQAFKNRKETKFSDAQIIVMKQSNNIAVPG